MSTRSPRRAAPGVLAVVLAFGFTACGSSSESASDSTTPAAPSSSAATSSAPGYCADADALRTSLEALGDVEVRRDGVDALESALADVRTDLDAAATSAAAELKPQLDEVRSAVDAVRTSADGLTTDNLTQKAPDIVAALRDLGTATEGFATSVRERCPTS